MPEILLVKADVPNPRITPVHPNIPQCPALLLGIGAVRSGKTNLLNNIIFRTKEEGFYDAQKYFDEIVFMSNTINNDPSARFIKKACSVIDHYSDGMIATFIESQKAYGERDEAPFTALFLDDILSKNMKRNSEISFLCTRYRHLNIGLLGIFTQNLKSVDTIIRNNATDVIIFKQTNNKQLMGCIEEWSGVYGGEKEFMLIYKKATEKPFDFLYLKVYEGKALRSFEEVLYEDRKILFDTNPFEKKIKQEEKEIKKMVKDEVEGDCACDK
jgi:hypothetical protein